MTQNCHFFNILSRGYEIDLCACALGYRVKYSNSATELPSDSVAQLARAWQAICQVAGSNSSLSHCHFSFSMTLTRLRSDCQVWNNL